MLKTLEVEPTEPQRGTVIWLHGLGSEPRALEPATARLEAPYLRFVFPAAPVRTLTIYGRARTPAWFDIISLAAPTPHEDALHLREMNAAIAELIEGERERGVAAENVVLAGFSQGGAMALHAGLRSEQRLAGILVVSGYLPASSALRAEANAERRDTPILFCHGRHDRVVPRAGGYRSYQFVKGAGYSADWAEFDVEHTVSLDELRFISGWIAARFPPARAPTPAPF